MPREWTVSEMLELERLWWDTPTNEICRIMNRHSSSVYRMAKLMDLQRSPEYAAKMREEQINTVKNAGKNSRFQKGHIPFNKGQKGLIIHGSEKSWFKPGHKPHNTKYDGAESVRRDGVYVRVKNGKWVQKTRLVWQEHFGPIPEGMFPVLIDKVKTNVVPENLMLVTRAQNMKRNTIHNYPPDVKKTIKIVSKLNRKIKKIKEEYGQK